MRRGAEEGDPRFPVGLDGQAFPHDAVVAAAARERHEVGREGGGHARKSLDPPHDIVRAGGDGLGRRVGIARHEQPERHQRSGVDAGVGVVDVENASHEDRGANEQHQRERDFGDHEHGAQAIARAVVAVLQRGRDAGAPGLKRRDEPERESRHHRHHRGVSMTRGLTAR